RVDEDDRQQHTAEGSKRVIEIGLHGQSPSGHGVGEPSIGSVSESVLTDGGWGLRQRGSVRFVATTLKAAGPEWRLQVWLISYAE
ncbi:MAG: hypothetical protein WCC36_01650, partial [Gammaproteobacteria bacterium]